MDLYYFYTDSQGRWHLLEEGKEIPEDVGNVTSIFCTDSDETKKSLLAVNQKIAPPGIIYILRCTHNTHYEMTREVLEHEGFRGGSLEVLAAGARDVDLYKFAVEAPHATSPQNKDGRPEGTAKENAERFIEWMKKLEDKFSSFLAEKKFQESLYVLGWMCHGIQDLYVHRGMTPREHIWLQSHKSHPDKNFNSDKCRDWTVKFYRKLQERYHLKKYGDNFFRISAPSFKRCVVEGLNDLISDWGQNLSEMVEFVGIETLERSKVVVDYVKFMFGAEPSKKDNLMPLHDWHRDPGVDWFWERL